MPLRAVFFDIGETLVDETRMWGAWAEALDVPALTRRGPWGLLHAAKAAAPVRVLESLMEVPELVDQLR